MIVVLYHGTSIESGESIMNNGFSLDYAGKGWGLTYGKGVYFTPNIKEAWIYSDGAILKCNVEINKSYRVKHKIGKMKNKWQKINDSLITSDRSEYVIRSPSQIKSIEKVDFNL